MDLPADAQCIYRRLHGHCYTATPDGMTIIQYWLPIMANHITKTAPAGADLMSWRY